jgi:hypothetical protein
MDFYDYIPSVYIIIHTWVEKIYLFYFFAYRLHLLSNYLLIAYTTFSIYRSRIAVTSALVAVPCGTKHPLSRHYNFCLLAVFRSLHCQEEMLGGWIAKLRIIGIGGVCAH